MCFNLCLTWSHRSRNRSGRTWESLQGLFGSLERVWSHYTPENKTGHCLPLPGWGQIDGQMDECENWIAAESEEAQTKIRCIFYCEYNSNWTSMTSNMVEVFFSFFKKINIYGGFLKDRWLPGGPLNQVIREIRKDNHSGTFWCYNLFHEEQSSGEGSPVSWPIW